jgi:hypothetical protein
VRMRRVVRDLGDEGGGAGWGRRVGLIEGGAEGPAAAAAAEGEVSQWNAQEVREVGYGDGAVGPGSEAVDVGWVARDAMGIAAVAVTTELVVECDELVEGVVALGVTADV